MLGEFVDHADVVDRVGRVGLDVSEWVGEEFRPTALLSRSLSMGTKPGWAKT